ncbi:MAG: hypothetical protein HFE51_10820 [Clostridia bacterium]|nr:hypothetical protein [Clostridia bacterium]
MAIMCHERLTISERDNLLSYAWLSQKEFARVMEIDQNTVCRRIKRGDYEGLYIMVGASRKFDSRKVKELLGLTA